MEGNKYDHQKTAKIQCKVRLLTRHSVGQDADPGDVVGLECPVDLLDDLFSDSAIVLWSGYFI